MALGLDSAVTERLFDALEAERRQKEVRRERLDFFNLFNLMAPLLFNPAAPWV
jgi:hypothetical protein